MEFTPSSALTFGCPIKISANLANRNCEGTACMAWRWSVPPEHVANCAKLLKEGNWARDVAFPVAKGYCGLAGGLKG